jgi:hypothetical protein
MIIRKRILYVLILPLIFLSFAGTWLSYRYIASNVLERLNERPSGSIFGTLIKTNERKENVKPIDELSSFLIKLQKDGEKFLKRDIPDCSEFMAFRNRWRTNIPYMVSLGDDFFDKFQQSWEEERACYHSQLDPSVEFLRDKRDKLQSIDTGGTKYEEDCKEIIASFDRQLVLYDIYKQNIDDEIDAMIAHYECRVLVSEGFDLSPLFNEDDLEEIPEETYVKMNDSLKDCYDIFAASMTGIYEEYERLDKDIMEEQNSSYTILWQIKDDMAFD